MIPVSRTASLSINDYLCLFFGTMGLFLLMSIFAVVQ